MTRARILADYVAGGTTAAEFDYLDGLTSTAVGINDTQTLANKTLASTTSFPAGHVIQTVYSTNNTQATSTGDNLVTCVSQAITLSSASNKIIVLWSVPFQNYSYGGSDNTSGTVHGGFQVASSGTGVTVETKKWGSWSSSGMYGIAQGDNTDTEKTLKGTHTATWVFTPATTNATTITVSATGYSDDTMQVNYEGGSTPYHNHSQIILHELQV